MRPELLEDDGLVRVEKALDLLARRQELLAGNLANASTPGYKTMDLRFDEILQGEMAEPWPLVRTSPRHLVAVIPEPQLRAAEVSGLAARPDGNNVRMERELLEMTLNRLRFQMAIQWATHRVRALRAAIQEGRA